MPRERPRSSRRSHVLEGRGGGKGRGGRDERGKKRGTVGEVEGRRGGMRKGWEWMGEGGGVRNNEVGKIETEGRREEGDKEGMSMGKKEEG